MKIGIKRNVYGVTTMMTMASNDQRRDMAMRRRRWRQQAFVYYDRRSEHAGRPMW